MTIYNKRIGECSKCGGSLIAGHECGSYYITKKEKDQLTEDDARFLAEFMEIAWIPSHSGTECDDRTTHYFSIAEGREAVWKKARAKYVIVTSPPDYVGMKIPGGEDDAVKFTWHAFNENDFLALVKALREAEGKE